MSSRRFGLVRAAILLAITASATSALADRNGDLLISPTRIQMFDRSRTGTLVVANLSRNAVRYRLNLVDMLMLPDGTLKRLDGDSPNSAKQYLRLSPREIALAPGASQTVRILATPPDSQSAGEVRSHLEFVPITRGAAPSTVEGQSNLQLKLDVRVVVTIPVIVNWGKTSSSAKLSDGSVSSKNRIWGADLRIQRQGNATVRGDLTAVFKPASSGTTSLLGKITGLPVYFPNLDRLVRLNFTKDPTKLGKGEVEITYTVLDSHREPPVKLAISLGG
jgi:hypothetical protein